MYSKEIIERFLSKVEKIPFHECWEWAGCKTHQGYGRFWLNGKINESHRASYEIHNGPIINDLCVLHKCDNRSCVNPRHLFLGTRTDNHKDMMKKGRNIASCGEKNGFSKLKEFQVLEIRKAYKEKTLSTRKLAKKYGVSKFAIDCVIYRKRWQHI